MTDLGIDVQAKVNKIINWDDRHGGPYDRGGADSYYRRGMNPHYFVGATYQGTRVEQEDMTQEEIDDYVAGYKDNEDAGDFKDWG